MLDLFEKAAAWDKTLEELDFDERLYIENPNGYDNRFGNCVDIEKLGMTQHQGAWVDVEAKAKRIATTGGVGLLHKRPYDLHKPAEIVEIKAKVTGDHGTYESTIHQPHPRSRAIRWWDCQCAWRRYVWNRTPIYIVDRDGVRREVNKKYEGRVCSHVLALWYYSAGIPVSYEEVPPEILKQNWMQLDADGRLTPRDKEQIQLVLDGFLTDEDKERRDESEHALSELEQREKAVADKIQALDDESIDLILHEPNKKIRKKRLDEIAKERRELEADQRKLEKERRFREQAPSRAGIQEAEEIIRDLEKKLENPDLSSDERYELEQSKELQQKRIDAMRAAESPNFAINRQLEEEEMLDYNRLIADFTSDRPFAIFGDSRKFEEIFNLNDLFDTNIYEGIDDLIDVFVDELSSQTPEDANRDQTIINVLKMLRNAISSSREIQDYFLDIRSRTVLLNKNKRNPTWVIDEQALLGVPNEKYIKGGLEKEITDRKRNIQRLLYNKHQAYLEGIGKDLETSEYYERQLTTPVVVPEPTQQAVYDANQILEWLRINKPMTNRLDSNLLSMYPEVKRIYKDERGLAKYRRDLRKKYRETLQMYYDLQENGTLYQQQNIIRDLYALKSEIEQQPGFSEVVITQKAKESSVSAGITFLSFDVPINDITIYVQSELAKGRNPKAYVRRSVTGEQRGGLHPHPDAMPSRTREDGSCIYTVDDLGYDPKTGQMGSSEEERHSYGMIPVGGEVDVLAVDPADRMMMVVHKLDSDAPNHTHIKVWLPIKDVDLI